MGAILAILANPVVTRPIAYLLKKLFTGEPKDKVTAPTAALTTLSVVVAVLRQLYPEFADVVQANVTPEMVGGVAAAVVAVVGYFKSESVA